MKTVAVNVCPPPFRILSQKYVGVFSPLGHLWGCEPGKAKPAGPWPSRRQKFPPGPNLPGSHLNIIKQTDSVLGSGKGKGLPLIPPRNWHRIRSSRSCPLRRGNTRPEGHGRPWAATTGFNKNRKTQVSTKPYNKFIYRLGFAVPMIGTPKLAMMLACCDGDGGDDGVRNDVAGNDDGDRDGPWPMLRSATSA